MWGVEGQLRGWGKGGRKAAEGEGERHLWPARQLQLLPPARTSSCKPCRHAAAPASWEVLLLAKQSWAGGTGKTEVIWGRMRLQMWGSYPPPLLPSPCFSGRGSETVIKSWSHRPSASDNLSARWQRLNSDC